MSKKQKSAVATSIILVVGGVAALLIWHFGMPERSEAMQIQPQTPPQVSNLHPLEVASIGEWVQYEYGDGSTSVQTLVSRSGDQAFVRTSRTAGNGSFQETLDPVSLDRAPSLSGAGVPLPPGAPARPAPNVSAETLTIGTHHLPCELITEEFEDGPLRRTWRCSAVPMGGVVKVEVDGQVVKQLVGCSAFM